MTNETVPRAKPHTRSEEDIFAELTDLCVSPGYIHALSLLCFRDNFVRYGADLTAEDMTHMFSESRLIRTEITTLVGLLIKRPIDFSHPGLATLLIYINQTEALLEELHRVLSAVMFGGMQRDGPQSDPSAGPDFSGHALREPIFYGGESAYGFQYRDFARKKHAFDDPWLRANKGFGIENACKVVAAVAALQDRNVMLANRTLRTMPQTSWTVLPGFVFNATEVAARANIDVGITERVLEAFACVDGAANAGFTSLHAYNAASGTPLLYKGAGEYILLQQYSLFEALYESPIFWFGADKSYAPTALANRGRFTEAFARERLEKVFGSPYVYANVDVWKNAKDKLSEIDVLILFGDRAIVVQAKSKRLTLEARRGNDLQIRSDFKKAVQESFDQAYLCATALVGVGPRLTDSQGNGISLPHSIKIVYPVCIVSDHYPALAFQARQFLQVQPAAKLAAPLVTDVFALDAITEMLGSPLRFLSYLDLRARFGDQLMATHEHTLLSYHLKYNLWFNDEYDFVQLHDEIAADLDIAMGARREGLPGVHTPDGILTRIRSTPLGRIISEIEVSPDPATIDLGLLLLTFSEDTAETVNRGIRQITVRAKQDGRKHDFTVGLGTSKAGLTMHCGRSDLASARERITAHCEVRKYSQKADRWFGLAVYPDGSLWFGVRLESSWKPNARLDAALQHWPKATARSPNVLGTRMANKIGRNESCPCGSGKKYKKCCLQR